MTTTNRVAYGARPVSMDLARGRVLAESEANAPPDPLARFAHSPVADQLALAHWPWGHFVVVCGLAGGTGRSTLAALFAAAIAELPYAHVHKPVALVEMQPRLLSTTRRRWLAEAAPAKQAPQRAVDRYRAPVTRSGIVLPASVPAEPQRAAYSVVVVEAPVGLPSEHEIVRADPTSSVLLVVRPDRRSLAETAEALVWMHDQGLVHRSRVVVVVNQGVGQVDRGSRAASTALAVRCRSVHKLAYNQRLGPTACLPSGTALAPFLRRPIQDICLDVWRSSQQTASELDPHLKEATS